MQLSKSLTYSNLTYFNGNFSNTRLSHVIFTAIKAQIVIFSDSKILESHNLFNHTLLHHQPPKINKTKPSIQKDLERENWKIIG